MHHRGSISNVESALGMASVDLSGGIDRSRNGVYGGVIPRIVRIRRSMVRLTDSTN
jgi:hypothetical protein